VKLDAVGEYLAGLQARLVGALEQLDGGRFRRDAWTRPDEQAAPALTAKPARSSAMTWVSLATPGNAMQVVLATRGAAAPKIRAPGALARSASSRRSRSAATRARSDSPAAMTAAAAAPKPAMPATFSVPA
jgi:hypothetical protein